MLVDAFLRQRPSSRLQVVAPGERVDRVVAAVDVVVIQNIPLVVVARHQIGDRLGDRRCHSSDGTQEAQKNGGLHLGTFLLLLLLLFERVRFRVYRPIETTSPGSTIRYGPDGGRLESDYIHTNKSRSTAIWISSRQ